MKVKSYQMNYSQILQIYALLAIITLSLAVFPACASENNGAQIPSVVVSDYKVTPAVLTAGEKGTVTVTLKSITPGTKTSSITSGGDTASMTSPVIPYIDSVTFKSKDIQLLSADSKFEGNIGPDQPIPITFYIRAPQKNGLYFPEIWIRVRDGQSLKFPVPVNVGTQLSVLRTPTLSLENTFPSMVKPGTKIEGNITIRNEGSSQADNIQVTVNGSPPSVIASGISSFQIENLVAGESVNRELSLLVDKNIPAGLIEAPVRMKYALLDGTSIEQYGSIGLDVRGEAELGITAVETTPTRITRGEAFDLMIRVQNTGTGDAKSVAAKIDLPISGTKEAFVGKIKPGNDAPATFILEGANPGEYNYTVTISWTDDWGEHSFTRDLSQTVPGSDGSGTIIVIVVVLIIAGAGAFWYWRRKAESDEMV
ncbi:MAG: S-layer protein [Methanomicrobiales archaeon HGW-Methanomicrobiales-4]|nr:MAG: S-layer protein [Methanomicrobiales archaeon HGW-Methanomicrobiales-4]